MQENLKVLLDMGYHERTYKGRQTSKFSEKTRPPRRVFSHLDIRLRPKRKDRNDPEPLIHGCDFIFNNFVQKLIYADSFSYS